MNKTIRYAGGSKMLSQTLVPIGSFSAVWNVTGISLLIICSSIVLGGKVKGWITVLVILCISMLWCGLHREVGGADRWKADKGYEILWRWENGTFHDTPQWGWGCSDSLYEKAKKERYYAMHVCGDIPCWLYHPDALWIAPLMVLILSLLLAPSWWPVLYLVAKKIIE